MAQIYMVDVFDALAQGSATIGDVKETFLTTFRRLCWVYLNDAERKALIRCVDNIFDPQTFNIELAEDKALRLISAAISRDMNAVAQICMREAG